MRKLTAFLEQLLNFGLKYPQDSLSIYSMVTEENTVYENTNV